MKTAEEWSNEWCEKMRDLGYEGYLTIEFVKRIQADALLHASGHIYNKTGDMMSIMRRPNCSEMANEIQGMARQLLK